MEKPKILSPLVLGEDAFLCVAPGISEMCIAITAEHVERDQTFLGHYAPFQSELPVVDVVKAMLSLMTKKQLFKHLLDVLRKIVS